MSVLTAALERISTWLEKHEPEQPTSLRPGLTSDEIEEQVRDLPYRLPKEVYELYQWRNGCNSSFFLFEYIEFYSLEEAIYASENLDIHWFVIFFGEDVGYGVVGDDEQKETSPVFSNDEPNLPSKPDYESLTSMMLKLAEYLETDGKAGDFVF